METVMLLIIGLVVGYILALMVRWFVARKRGQSFPELPNRPQDIDFNNPKFTDDQIADLVAHVFCVRLHGLLKTDLTEREAIMITVEQLTAVNDKVTFCVIDQKDITVYYKDATKAIKLGD